MGLLKQGKFWRDLGFGIRKSVHGKLSHRVGHALPSHAVLAAAAYCSKGQSSCICLLAVKMRHVHRTLAQFYQVASRRCAQLAQQRRLWSEFSATFRSQASRTCYRLVSDIAQERRKTVPIIKDAKREEKPGDSPKSSSFGNQLRELQRVKSENDGVAAIDDVLIPKHMAVSFPKLPMTSLSSETIYISEKAVRSGVTLVLVAFRSFADEQVMSWREPFAKAFDREGVAQIFDISVNETFASQVLSGFVQRLQRRSIDVSCHGFYVALNESAKVLESILPSSNSLFGYAILLDRDGCVRFRAAGTATEKTASSLIAAASELLQQDNSTVPSRTEKPPKQFPKSL